MKKMQLNKKSPDFQVVVGPFKGHKYVHGKVYAEDQIPPMELKHFYDVEAVVIKNAKPNKKAKAETISLAANTENNQ